MSLTWYAKRLARMSPFEIAHRLREQAKHSISRMHSYGWEAFPSDLEPLPVAGLAATVSEQMTGVLDAATDAAAEALLEGRFAVHGVAWPRRDPGALFPDEVWRFDPVTGRLWPGPERYTFDYSFRHERDLGDIKYVWDFNRLQFLQPLAVRVAVAGDARALTAVEAAIESWSRCNPPYRGIAWNSGIELALRAASLILVVSLCKDRLAPATRARVGQILAAHFYWLRRYPSLHSSANNHAVAEALGIFAIASVMPHLDGGGAARHSAKAMLEREALLQIFPDGVGAEQSPTYGAFTAEMLLVADIVGQAVGDPLTDAVGARLEAFASHIGWLADRHGRVPSIGDDDEGRVLTLSGLLDRTYPASVARAIAGYRGVASTIAPDGVGVELRDALVPPLKEPAPPPEGVRTFEIGGYTVVREARAGHRLHLVLDHGPLGYLSIAAHGHADACAMILSLDDEPVLVDPGTYLYHSGAEWRDWFRGTRAHNTLAVEGADSSSIAGPFNWSRKATGRLLEARTGEGSESAWTLTVSHDGYQTRFGVEHVRTVAASFAGVEIVDRFEGTPTGPLAVEIAFQFAPGLSVEGKGIKHFVRRGSQVILEVTLPNSGRIAIAAGGLNQNEGWVSPSFGIKTPAARLVWSGTMPKDGLRTTLRWD